MKTSYSRRELYAVGEPIGESATRVVAGRRIYGGGGGGFLGGIGDTISGVVNSIGDLGEGALNTVSQAGDAVDDLGTGLDQTVRSTIPGGWTTAALLASGAGGLDGFLGGAGSGTGEALSGIDLGGAGGSPASWLNGSSAAGAAGAGAGAGIGAAGDGYLSGIDLGGAGGSPATMGGSAGIGAAGDGYLSGVDLGGAGGSPGTMGGSYADAIGADNIDVGGGYNPATGAGDAATAAGAAATGVTSSAGIPHAIPAGGLASLAGKAAAGAGSNSGSGGLTLGGGLLGAAGLAGLLSMLQSDSSRYGVPGRQDNAGPMSQFKYNPASFSASRPDPNMFRPQGVQTAKVGYASGGGISTLGGYSDGGRLLKGPGDGMSDDIPAKIGHKQPARLADGEFVVPADVVSHLGNGSTDAGAKQLYKMMDNIRSARTGRKAQGKQIKADKYLPK